MIETEGMVCTRSVEYKFLNRSPRLLATKPILLPADGKPHQVELKVDFPRELSGHAIIKFLLAPKRTLQMVKVPIARNTLKLAITNSSGTDISHPVGAFVGIVDVRSLGYFHVGMDRLQKNVLKEYGFKSLQQLEYQMNQMIDFVNENNRPQKGKYWGDPYLWLDRFDPHRHLTDEQILDCTIDLSSSYLSSHEKL